MERSDRQKISDKDKLILQQMDLIVSLTEKNLKRMDADFWGGAPTSAPADAAPGTAQKTDAPKDPPAAASTGNDVSSSGEPEAPPPEKLEDLLEELDGYIGLGTVKEEVRSLVNLAKYNEARRKNDLPVSDLSLHMVFSGNPGTGKTTIARFMARVYHSLGILSKGQLNEVDRSRLVAGYVGQTAIKTTKELEKALGGVLFIDEAYMLNGAGENDFGQEAIDTVLKFMEDHRDDLVVIVAGYVDLMDEFVHSNPGLESRFNRFIHFPDYTADELMGIFDMRMKKGNYQLTDEARAALEKYLGERSAADPIAFGNGRGVRNTFEDMLKNQANRVAGLEEPTKDDLSTLTRDDLPEAAKAYLPEKPAETANDAEAAQETPESTAAAMAAPAPETAAAAPGVSTTENDHESEEV